MTHQNTSGVGCARTAQKHVSPQNGASSKLEGSAVQEQPRNMYRLRMEHLQSWKVWGLTVQEKHLV